MTRSWSSRAMNRIRRVYESPTNSERLEELTNLVTALSNQVDELSTRLDRTSTEQAQGTALLAETTASFSENLDAMQQQLTGQGQEQKQQRLREFMAIKGAAIPYLEEIRATMAERQWGLEETLQRIVEDRLSFARFGEGEFRLMTIPGFNLHFQEGSKELTKALSDVFSAASNPSTLADNRLLIGFPQLFRDRIWSPIWIDVWPGVRDLIGSDATFGNSHVSRPIFFKL